MSAPAIPIITPIGCSSSERGGTAQFASRLVGEREVLHTSASKTRQPTAWLSSVTSSELLKIEPAVMASEIERLPDLHGFFKLASTPDWVRVQLEPVEYPTVVRRPAPASADAGQAAGAVPASVASAPIIVPSGAPETLAPSMPPKARRPGRPRKVKPPGPDAPPPTDERGVR